MVTQSAIMLIHGHEVHEKSIDEQYVSQEEIVRESFVRESVAPNGVKFTLNENFKRNDMAYEVETESVEEKAEELEDSIRFINGIIE